jgi:hypothetical protein
MARIFSWLTFFQGSQVLLYDHGSLGFCRVVACGTLKPVQQATLVGLTRPFLHCDRQRVANVAVASGEIQKNHDHYAWNLAWFKTPES